ncbi:hypothetical protein IMX26_10575 [Clostridium sp. 'deep sea']|uniref:hypothetical protein n=1 Tax=Clostridium sp. 'deep sea' TaxID=2779445 RepID=UPI0018965A19|nr:hypothetical protein [Clostridium sp. 'deep sea']QOR33936.1 hypothetical protein IMX26_10575 [Clostridium sp. 'deep sea']
MPLDYTSKTNWQKNDIVTEHDFNRIEKGVSDVVGIFNNLSPVYEGAVEPDTSIYKMWIDTSNTPYVKKFWDGSTWVVEGTYA